MILNSQQTGTGAPVLLLHGLLGSAKNLGVIARGLADRARVISIDLRNHGASLHDEAMDYPTMAADIVATMADLAIPKADIVGHSMGGKVAMRLALERPDLVGRLAVLDIAPVRYRHGFADYLHAMRGIELSPALTRHEADAALSKAVPEAHFRAFLLNNLVLGESPHWRAALPEIAASMSDILDWPAMDAQFDGPVLFLGGAKSTYIPGHEPAIAALFPHAQIEMIENASHWLHAEQPGLIVSMLRRFLFG
jgi:pimeloyl-ACP methyl ester carboxylesterase